jgi:hypothetical protein
MASLADGAAVPALSTDENDMRGNLARFPVSAPGGPPKPVRGIGIGLRKAPEPPRDGGH